MKEQTYKILMLEKEKNRIKVWIGFLVSMDKWRLIPIFALPKERCRSG